MASRREHGAPSALTVLEVAEGLRWADPALGASLAEHVRRLAGDDATVRAAADRSMIQSLEESDRHEDVVERGVPLLVEARERGDRDDGAAVLVELAAAATGLGDAGLARRLLDRLGPVTELPARIAAVACAARAEACAAEGDVAGTDAAGEDATPTLLRVSQPDSTVVRARLALARGVARRRAGDVDGALATLGRAISTDPAGDIDGGRRSLQAAAEETELLVEAGRPDEARARARSVLPDGTPGAHLAGPVGRIRLSLAATSGQGTASATTVAEELESTGRAAEAARAWELVAGVSETAGDLGQALAALRRGHALASRARDAADRALRMLASVADGPDPLSPTTGSSSDPGTQVAEDAAVPTRRRERRDGADAFAAIPSVPESALAPTGAEALATAMRAPVADETPAPDGPAPTAPAGTSAGERTAGVPDRGATEAPLATSVDAPPVSGPGSVPRSSTRDELAELLASLTRSVDSSRAAASAMGLDSAAPEPSEPEPAVGAPSEPEGARRSRHSAFPVPTAQPVAEPAASRPTFDAFSTAPMQRITDDGVSPTVAPLPDDRFAAAGRAGEVDPPRQEDPRAQAEPVSVSDLVDPLADPLGKALGAESEPASSMGRGGLGPDERGRDAGSPSGSDLGRTDGGGSGTARSRSTWSDNENGRASLAVPTTSAPVGQAAQDGTERDRRDSDRDVPGSPGSTAESTSTTWGHSGFPGAEDSAPPVRHGAGSAPSGDAASVTRRGSGDAREDRAGARVSERSETSSVRRDGSADRTGLVSPATGTPGRSDLGDPPATSATVRGSSPRPADEYEEELAVTLATVLGEYHLPDVPMPPRRERNSTSAEPPTGTPSGTDLAVPSARRHTSGSMPVPGDQRWAARAESGARPAAGEPVGGRPAPSSNGRGRPPESGARLADLLAEAMDAFRHVGPEAQDGARAPGVGSRRA